MGKERMKRYFIEQRKILSDWYIRNLLLRHKKYKKEDITPGLVSIKRAEVLIYRIEQKMKNAGYRICRGCKKKKKIDDFFYNRRIYLKTGKINFTIQVCKKCSNEK